jgi:hypothetical protein
MVTLVLWLTLSLLSELDFRDILLISAVITIAAYLIGDLLLLSISNNTIATISDIGLAFIMIYLINYLFIGKEIRLLDALISCVAIGVGEWFFHKYVFHNVLPNNKVE